MVQTGEKVKPYTRITKEEFDRVQQLHKLGIPRATIATIVGRPQGTLHSIVSVDNWEDFLEAKRVQAERFQERYKKKLEAAHTPPADPVDTKDEATEQDATDEPDMVQDEPSTTASRQESPLSAEAQLVLLNRIANALERMADAWENSPEKKKGLFNR